MEMRVQNNGKAINQTHLEVKAQEGASIKLDIKTKHLKVKSVTGWCYRSYRVHQKIKILNLIYMGYIMDTIFLLQTVVSKSGNRFKSRGLCR